MGVERRLDEYLIWAPSAFPVWPASVPIGSIPDDVSVKRTTHSLTSTQQIMITNASAPSRRPFLGLAAKGAVSVVVSQSLTSTVHANAPRTTRAASGYAGVINLGVAVG